jgi:hypothetical protein
LVEFLAERVRHKCRTYPRTLLALLGEEDLRDRGWLSTWMQNFVLDAKAESGSYFQPWDQAGVFRRLSLRETTACAWSPTRSPGEIERSEQGSSDRRNSTGRSSPLPARRG